MIGAYTFSACRSYTPWIVSFSLVWQATVLNVQFASIRVDSWHKKQLTVGPNVNNENYQNSLISHHIRVGLRACKSVPLVPVNLAAETGTHWQAGRLVFILHILCAFMSVTVIRS